jgi:hypothetical protein
MCQLLRLASSNFSSQLHLRIRTQTYVQFGQYKTFLKEHFDNSTCSAFRAYSIQGLQLLLVGVVELRVCYVLAARDGEVGDVG